MTIPISRNPIHNHSINPIHNHSINPIHNYSINPIHNYSINPIHNYSINPIHNYSINPIHNYSINPIHNSSLSPIHNNNIPGWYRFDKVGNYQGFTVNTKENDFLLEYDKGQKLRSFWVKRGTGYCIFEWATCEYKGYAETDGGGKYNIFETGGTWIGYLR